MRRDTTEQDRAYRAHARRVIATGPALVFYDIETTGIDRISDPAPLIWDIAAIRREPDGRRTETERVIEIGCPIPSAANIAGVDPELPAKIGRPAGEVLPRFGAHIAGAVLVGHNIVAFDNPIMAAHFARLGLPAPVALTEQRACIDTLLIARALFSDHPNPPDRYRLMDIAAHLRVRLPDGVLHRAIDDTRLVEGVFDALARELAARAD